MIEGVLFSTEKTKFLIAVSAVQMKTFGMFESEIATLRTGLDSLELGLIRVLLFHSFLTSFSLHVRYSTTNAKLPVAALTKSIKMLFEI